MSIELFLMLNLCNRRYFVVPETRRKREKVIQEIASMVSDPVRQAVKALHSTDSVLDHHAGGSLLPVFFFLFRRQLRIGVFLGFSRLFVRQMYFGIGIIRVGTQESQVEPDVEFLKPG